jgi:hypothetical protein
MVVGYGIGVAWGAMGIAVAHTVVTCLLWYPSVAYCCRTAPVDPIDVCTVMIMPAAAAIGAGFGLLMARSLLPQSAPVALAFLLDFVVYAAFYLGAWVVIPTGRRNLAHFIVLLREAIAKRPEPRRSSLSSTGRNAEPPYSANALVGPAADDDPTA